MHWLTTLDSSSALSGSLPFLFRGLDEPWPEPDDVPEDDPDDVPEDDPDDVPEDDSDDVPEDDPDVESADAPVVGVEVAGAWPDVRGLLLVAMKAKATIRTITRMAATIPIIIPAWELFRGATPTPAP